MPISPPCVALSLQSSKIAELEFLTGLGDGGCPRYEKACDMVKRIVGDIECFIDGGEFDPEDEVRLVGNDGKIYNLPATPISSEGDDIALDGNITLLSGRISYTLLLLTPAIAATAAIDLLAANMFKIQMPAGNINIGATGVIAGPVTIIVKQDAIGGRTATWDGIYKFANGAEPFLSEGANAVDVFTFTGDGTSLYINDAVYNQS